MSERINEQWKRWEPIPNLMATYSLEHVHNGMRGIEILLADLADANKKVHIVFSYTMISYTVSNPVGRSIDMNKNDSQREKAPCNNWSFFEVMHSKYIAHLVVQSATIVELSDPRHFAILATNANIDIISSYEPDITYITIDLATKTFLYKEMTMPYIVRNLPTARIILYEPESKDKIDEQQQLNLALDCGTPLDAALLKLVEKDLEDSDVPLPCTILDLRTLTDYEQREITTKGIAWRQ